MSKDSSTRVSAVLTDCPPGPEDAGEPLVQFPGRYHQPSVHPQIVRHPDQDARQRSQARPRARRGVTAGRRPAPGPACGGRCRTGSPPRVCRRASAPRRWRIRSTIRYSSSGLEGQDPLVVVEREAGHGVGPDVRVLAGHLAVLGQHLAALGRVQQVPVVRPHERVDAHVGLGSSSARNAGMWPLLNSAGRCSAITDQTGSLARPSRVAAEPRVHLLQVVGGRRDPPEHVVGVGAQALHVVAAAGHGALARRLLEQPGHLVGDHGAVAGIRTATAPVERRPVADPEHRPHRVADQLVQVPGPEPGRLAPGAAPFVIRSHGPIVRHDGPAIRPHPRWP